MWLDAERKEFLERPLAAHVIVFGNEKGGTGKSTTAIHVAIALMKAGQRVATIDLDARQRTFTRFIENRRAWARWRKLPLEIPTHFCISRVDGIKVDENEAAEFSGFAAAVGQVERTHDFLIIDTPGTDTYLARLAHLTADTLITPLNDSFLDLDVLGLLDPHDLALTGPSYYTELVREARRQRRTVDGRAIDWIVMLNRWSPVGADKKRDVAKTLNELSGWFGFWVADGLAERQVYRELFPRGLTALDELDDPALAMQAGLAQDCAREEVQALVPTLMLPFNERARKRAETRAEWFTAAGQTLELDDILAVDAAE